MKPDCSTYGTKHPYSILAFIVLCALLITGCGSSGANGGDDIGSDTGLELLEQESEDIVSEAPPADQLYAEIATTDDPAVLFETLCTKCHGKEGLGDGPSLGSLNVTGTMNLTALDHRSDEELMEIITYGTGVDMPAWGLILSLEQRQALVEYVRSLGE